MESENDVGTGQRIVNERWSAYGDPVEMHQRIASAWSAVLGVDVYPIQVALMMAQLKIIREAHRHDDDNLDDAEGYLHIARLLNHGWEEVQRVDADARAHSM